ncbi:hypothetical protein HDU93_008241 [Gonapodya sp. JEL0774]|nr:hypothetical protein HDU93_008241 [Gonapodya sp. JEL0774]
MLVYSRNLHALVAVWGVSSTVLVKAALGAGHLKSRLGNPRQIADQKAWQHVGTAESRLRPRQSLEPTTIEQSGDNAMAHTTTTTYLGSLVSGGVTPTPSKLATSSATTQQVLSPTVIAAIAAVGGFLVFLIALGVAWRSLRRRPRYNPSVEVVGGSWSKGEMPAKLAGPVDPTRANGPHLSELSKPNLLRYAFSAVDRPPSRTPTDSGNSYTSTISSDNSSFVFPLSPEMGPSVPSGIHAPTALSPPPELGLPDAPKPAKSTLNPETRTQTSTGRGSFEEAPRGRSSLSGPVVAVVFRISEAYEARKSKKTNRWR